MRIGFMADGSLGQIVKSAWTEARGADAVRVESRNVVRDGETVGRVSASPLIPALVANAGDLIADILGAEGHDDGTDAVADRVAVMAHGIAQALAAQETGVESVAPGRLTLRVREGRDENGDPTFAYVIGRGRSGGRTLTLDGSDPISAALRAGAYARHTA